ncbi:MAG: peptide chain release factor N(5)-glutamine methyltransferase [Actinobacteria bacterium]|nr:peptide chain release factor N(5)-glutamine methyltransferase [Actinomycetota bacterium]
MSAVAGTATDATVGDALGAASDALLAAGVPDGRLDAEVLLAAASGRGRASLIADPSGPLPPAVTRLYGEFVRRRLRREPVAYIVGTKGFRRIELVVDRRVLVPRPETELLVEVALERGPERVLDVGTGSGAIALALADELPEATIVATDTSPGALEVARANADRLGLADRVHFAEGTVPEGRSFDLVLANLPYVAERDWAGLEPEVTQWEPREALLAGEDGLDAYRDLLAPMDAGPAECLRPTFSDAPEVLAGAAAVAVEIGEGQAIEVAELMRDAGFGEVSVREDLAGIERVVVGER